MSIYGVNTRLLLCKRSFTLIELMVTISIIGLLVVTIIPMMSRYNRNTAGTTSAQQVRESLAEILSYATSPDPSNCPMIVEGKQMPTSIISYSFYYGANTPTNYYKDGYFGYQANTKYICGMDGIETSLALNSNQYAILAIGADYETPTTLYTLGIVRVGKLDGSATFCSPEDGVSASNIINLGFNVPSGDFVLSSESSENYLSTTNGSVYSLGVTYTTQALAHQKFAMIGIKTVDNFMYTIFINVFTGQVTSTGKVPVGFVAI